MLCCVLYDMRSTRLLELFHVLRALPGVVSEVGWELIRLEFLVKVSVMITSPVGNSCRRELRVKVFEDVSCRCFSLAAVVKMVRAPTVASPALPPIRPRDVHAGAVGRTSSSSCTRTR